MASLYNKQTEIYFFRILMERSLQLLRIPIKFTVEYGFNLPNPVCLKPPDGTEWKIFWSKTDGDIWFQNGWKEFVSYYSLDRGYLVLFKYVEASHFEVLLFDKTNLQIEYPSHVPCEENPNLDDQFSDDSIEILGGKPAPSKDKSKSPSLLPRPQKKQKVGTNGDLEPRSCLKSKHFHVQTEGRQSQGTKLEKSNDGNAHRRSAKKKLEGNLGSVWELNGERSGRTQKGRERKEDMAGHVFTNHESLNSENKTRRPGLTFTEKTEALNRAKTFRSENPFFTVIIPPSYICKNTPVLHIPIKFAEEHLEEEEGTLTLEVLEGVTWPATYVGNKIVSGWHKFAIDNNLKVGDTCVFEITDIIELSLKVSIYRAPEDPSCSFSQGGKSTQRISKSLLDCGVKRVLEKVKKFESDNPYFTVRITPCHLKNSKPYVRRDFYKSWTTEREKSILIKVGKRSWHAKLICEWQQKSSSTRFSAGWTAFARENNLQVGDVCIFELINRDDGELRAHIFRCHR